MKIPVDENSFLFSQGFAETKQGGAEFGLFILIQFPIQKARDVVLHHEVHFPH